MEIKEIVKNEATNTDKVVLYQEGIFYKAYEHSAYAFSRFIRPFKIKKRRVKAVGMDVVSLGFPMTSLEQLIEGRTIEHEEKTVKVILKEEELIDGEAFSA